MELSELAGMTPDLLAQLANVRVTSLETLTAADAEEVFIDVRGISLGGLRDMQAFARTFLLRDSPRTPKIFIAVQNISVESIHPKQFVPSGERINLWWKSDAEIEVMVREGVVVDDDAKAHLIAGAGWLPELAKKHLMFGGIFSLEALAENGEAGFSDQVESCVDWLGRINVERGTALGWVEKAKQEIAPRALEVISE